ncbi:MAG: hypothetical protein GXP13_07160 [Gammaproteobacteria bacterium]|nr:hypothetical protein [Gammaproteobacteria bacterium]
MKSHASHNRVFANNSTTFMWRVTLLTGMPLIPALASATVTINDTREHQHNPSNELSSIRIDNALTTRLMKNLKRVHLKYSNQLATTDTEQTLDIDY